MTGVLQVYTPARNNHSLLSYGMIVLNQFIVLIDALFKMLTEISKGLLQQ